MIKVFCDRCLTHTAESRRRGYWDLCTACAWEFDNLERHFREDTLEKWRLQMPYSLTNKDIEELKAIQHIGCLK